LAGTKWRVWSRLRPSSTILQNRQREIRLA